MTNTRLTMRRIGALMSLLLLAIMLLTIAGARAEQPVNYNVTTPRDFLGYDIGQDYKITPWQSREIPGEGMRKGIVDYARELQRTSDRVRVFEYGRSEMGRPMIISVITSPENWQQIDNLKGINKLLADPRQVASDELAAELAAQGKAVYWLCAAIHADERTSPEVLLRLAYRLAAYDDPWTLDVLDKLVIVLDHTINPDGLDIVTDWYYQYKDTSWVGSSPPYYNKYVGHDNNRDFVGLALAESQANVNARFEWNPTVYHDLHQAKDLLYMSPGPDPTNEAVSPITMAEWLAYAGYNITQLGAAGFKGAFTYDYADMWYPGYNHGFSFMHNSNGRFYELQGATYASPATLTQPGRELTWFNPFPYKVPLTLHLMDAVDLEEQAIRNDLEYTAKNKDELLLNFYLKGKTNMEKASSAPPYAFVIPQNGGDNADVVDMLNNLQMHRIEISQATMPFVAGGQQFAAGDYVIRMDQPYGLTAKNFLTPQVYPAGKIPYDVTAWTYPFARDVNTVAITDTVPSSLSLVPVTGPVPYSGRLSGAVSTRYAIAHESNNNLARALPRLFKDPDMRVSQADAEFAAAGQTFPAGTFVVRTPGTDAAHQKLAQLAHQLGLNITALDADVAGTLLRAPRLGVYSSDTVSYFTMPEGWVRLELDKSSEFEYSRLYPTDIMSGSLAAYDVIVLPDLDVSMMVNGIPAWGWGFAAPGHRDGFGQVGVANLKAFVERGGTLVAMGNAATMPVKYNWPVGVTLPAVAEAAAAAQSTPHDLKPPDFGGRKPEAGAATAGLLAPGTLLKAQVDPNTPVGYGYDTEEAVWFDATVGYFGPALNTPFFVPVTNTTASVVAWYPEQGSPLLSGFIQGGEVLNGKAAIVDAPLGQGHVVMIGPNVLYRGQVTGDYMFFFNAILEGGRVQMQHSVYLPIVERGR